MEVRNKRGKHMSRIIFIPMILFYTLLSHCETAKRSEVYRTAVRQGGLATTAMVTLLATYFLVCNLFGCQWTSWPCYPLTPEQHRYSTSFTHFSSSQMSPRHSKLEDAAGCISSSAARCCFLELCHVCCCRVTWPQQQGLVGLLHSTPAYSGKHQQ